MKRKGTREGGRTLRKGVIPSASLACTKCRDFSAMQIAIFLTQGKQIAALFWLSKLLIPEILQFLRAMENHKQLRLLFWARLRGRN